VTINGSTPTATLGALSIMVSDVHTDGTIEGVFSQFDHSIDFVYVII
jgi:hypothetical protein